jgi:hypothetical protein
MKWKLKIWNGPLMLAHFTHAAANQPVIVAEYTEKAAVARLNAVKNRLDSVSLYYFRKFYSKGANQIATSSCRRPGVWHAQGWGDSYTLKELKT